MTRPTFWLIYRSPWVPVNVSWWALEDLLRRFPPHKRVHWAPTDKWALDWGHDARGGWVRVLGLEISGTC